MIIQLNGQPRTLAENYTLASLVDELQLTGRLAVEINGDIVPRRRFAEHPLHDGDRIEIVRAIGGG
ncbi:MAG: sulfur carrier protein ThiS [Gammaproteobacteria bacterium]